MNFSERIKIILDKGIETAKSVTKRTTETAKTWGEMGLVKIDILNLKAKLEKATAKLGASTFSLFVEKGLTSLSTADLSSEIDEIKAILAKIEDKEVEYKKLGGKDKDLN